ncbi:MAG: NUDIX hydrolase [Dehalococcoidia bacterium]
MSDREPGTERVVASRRIYDGRICNLRIDTVELPDGRQAAREIVEHDPVAVIVPVHDNGDVVLVRQFRLAIGRVMLEVPAGVLDPGEDIEAAAQRELQEETGLRARTMTPLGGVYASPGFLTEYMHLFLAEGLEDAPLEPDEDEDIVVRRMPLSQALALIDSGGIVDAKSVCGLLLVARRRA